MKVILTADVKGQGKKGDIIEVSDGYARNYLLRNALATEATSSGINSIKLAKSAEVHKRETEKAEAMELAKKINAAVVTVSIKVGEKGKLFGALNTQSIADAALKAGLEIDKRKIVLNEPIKTVGTHIVTVKPYAEVSAKLKIEVVPLREDK